MMSVDETNCTTLDRLQVAVAMSKILPLWRIKAAAPDSFSFYNILHFIILFGAVATFDVDCKRSDLFLSHISAGQTVGVLVP